MKKGLIAVIIFLTTVLCTLILFALVLKQNRRDEAPTTETEIPTTIEIIDEESDKSYSNGETQDKKSPSVDTIPTEISAVEQNVATESTTEAPTTEGPTMESTTEETTTEDTITESTTEEPTTASNDSFYTGDL